MPFLLARILLSSVVFPLPKYPVSSSTGVYLVSMMIECPFFKFENSHKYSENRHRVLMAEDKAKKAGIKV